MGRWNPDDANGPHGGSTLFVRPYGYVEPRPIIRQLGERNLFLGNKFAAIPAHHDERFDAVISLTDDRYPLTTHFQPLIDGPGNEWLAFADAVHTARALYRSDGRVLVHCHAGISRSSAVLATTLAAEEGRSFHDAIAIVQRARPHAVLHPALHELGVIYLAAMPFD